eukprot:TRINITY_DN2263_c0_g1_i1.p1 TRINITY_DN2263_c0_g1~~TRINITY_DN2263_c0_g1_i1.p1  ORF type:complete len:461 (+),score=135.96 TRINITY_DN2263_c0_g1_i1:114-1496(+)
MSEKPTNSSATNAEHHDKDKAPKEETTTKDEEEEEDDDDAEPESIRRLLMEMQLNEKKEKKEIHKQLASFDMKTVCSNLIKEKKYKNIVVMCGAGISVSAGIPDFRSPSAGLYANLQKYNLVEPEQMFDISFFKENPKPFYGLARELFPGTFNPTPTHYFLKLLQEKGLLLRCYSQNVDGLEFLAGLDKDLVVQAHGGFETSSCVKCHAKCDTKEVKESIMNGKDPICPKKDCGGYVKPDIVFFGENLPSRFYDLIEKDFSKADLLIVLGTSLKVHPFASLIDRVPSTCVRLLLNREQVGHRGKKGGGGLMALLASLGGGEGFRFGEDDNERDVFFQGDCDYGVSEFVENCGWKQEFITMVDKAIQANKLSKLVPQTWPYSVPFSAASSTAKEKEKAKEKETKTTDSKPIESKVCASASSSSTSSASTCVSSLSSSSATVSSSTVATTAVITAGSSCTTI